MKKKRKKAPPPPKSKATIFWPVLAFLGLVLLVVYQSIGDVNICKEGIEVPAEVINISSTWSEDHEYGRSLKIFNVELKYAVAGQTVSVLKTFNDGEVGKLFGTDVVIGDTVTVLVDEDKPRRFRLVLECGRG
jgi:hypothetical protein